MTKIGRPLLGVETIDRDIRHHHIVATIDRSGEYEPLLAAASRLLNINASCS